MPIFNWPVEYIENVLLIFTRVAGIFLSAPVLNSSRMMPQIKIGLSMMVAIVLCPVVGGATAAAPKELFSFVFLMMKEAVVGMSIGFIAAMVFATVQMAGEIADLQAGFAFAGIVDPSTGMNTTIIGQFQMMMAWLVFLAIDGHHILLNGVAESFNVLPLASFAVNTGVVGGIMDLASRMFVIALQIGAPILGAVLLGDLALGLLARTVPQMNLLVLGFPIKITLGLIVVLIALPVTLSLDRDLVYLMKQSVSQLISLAVR